MYTSKKGRTQRYDFIQIQAVLRTEATAHYTYNDENDREYTAAGGGTNHFEALRLVLAFDSVTVEYNPNVIYFKGDCGVMYINNVQCVSVNSGCMLGDIVTVTAGTSNGQRKYTFLFQ